VLDVVRNGWRPFYTFTAGNDSLTNQYPITNMNTTAWCVEAYVYPTSSPDNEQYTIDFRNPSSYSGSGFAVGIARYTTSTPNFFRPVVYSAGTVAQTGTGGATQRPSSGPTNFFLNTMAHIAVVKQVNDSSNLYMYLNGQSCGTVPIGTNYTTGVPWAQQSLGKLVDISMFRFYGTLAGLHVSNYAVYTQPFTPPDYFKQDSSTTFLFMEQLQGKGEWANLKQHRLSHILR